MISVKGLSKIYGKNVALDNISFEINDGEVVGLLGPNGAGKTTTMNIITGYLSSTDGDVFVDGMNVLQNPGEVKKLIGYLPENPPLYADMTVIDYLDFVYDLKKVKLDKRAHIDEVSELVKIGDVKNRLIKNLSKGYRQRIGIAQALIGNPKILILDEPTVGLDPRQINEIKEMIRVLGESRTIILSSHILSEISSVCEKIIVINKGRIVANDTLDNVIKGFTDSTTVITQIVGNSETVSQALSDIAGVTDIEAREVSDTYEGTFEYIIKTDGSADIRMDIFNIMSKLSCPVVMINNRSFSLEEVFLKITDKPRSAAEKKPKPEAEQKGADAE